MNKNEMPMMGGAPANAVNPLNPVNPGNPGNQVDPNQQVETQAYVPTYKIKPEFQSAVLKAIGKYPFNQIQAVMQAIKVDVMDHNTLTQIMNAIGSFPYENVAGLLTNINSFIEMVQPEDPIVDEVPTVEAPPVATPNEKS